MSVVLMANVLFFSLQPAAHAGATAPAPAANRTAPDFTRVDLDQRPVSLADYRGKVILLNFWATWCAPCLAEVPRFADWQRKYGQRGLQLVGVSMDEEEQPVRTAYQKYGLNYPVVMGDEKLGEAYGGVLGLPVTFLIDRKGKVRIVYKGATDLNVIEHQVQSLLSER